VRRRALEVKGGDHPWMVWVLGLVIWVLVTCEVEEGEKIGCEVLGDTASVKKLVVPKPCKTYQFVGTT
jgi:hypothetical protein